MFSLLPPIGMVDIAHTNVSKEELVVESCQDTENNLNVVVVTQTRPPSRETPTRFENPEQHPLTLRDDIFNKDEDAYLPRSHECSKDTDYPLEYDKNNADEVAGSQGDEYEIFRTQTAKFDGCLDEAADRLEDLNAGQPQKLSFENELTFIPKLNSLSLKIAQSRSSIAQRIRVGYENRVAALEEEMSQNFTFKPNISENSSKIAGKLKTDFWTRQKLHTEKQRKMLETGPSTWHPRLRLDSVPKHNGTFTDSLAQRKEVCLSLSDQVIQKHNSGLSVTKQQDDSPYAKSFDSLIFKQKRLKRGSHESPPHKLESLRPRALKKLGERNAGSEKCQGEISEISAGSTENRSGFSSPRKSKTENYMKPVTVSSLNSFGNMDGKQNETAKNNHRRSKTTPANQRYCKTIDPDRFLKTKNAAEHALKNKKVFICMGPYPVLRACLRKRGWIEKYFKADIACSSSAHVRSPDSDKDSDDDVVDDDPATSNSEKIDTNSKKRDLAPDTSSTSNCNQKASNENEVSKKGDSMFGPFFADKNHVDDGFESDSQYGIMSRIVRNAVPTLIWTCRRSDIDFKFLTKDQIVNHFVHASSFTTKFGLCVNLRHLPWFESVDPDSFFPRCHRLCSDGERMDFIDDFRMLSAIGILSHTIKRQTGMNTSTSKERIISSRALLLAIKACYGYIKRKDHLDIDGDSYETNYCLPEESWEQLVEYYYQVSSGKSFIVNADNYTEECKTLLEKMNEIYPQISLNDKNIWIVKPGAKSRGRGIMVMNNLAEILKLISPTVSKKENKWVVQKYIERPLLIYNTKFDIRQWFLVTDWNPLTLWFYKDCYLRFCSQEYTLDNLDPQYHLANNSIQKDYRNGPRSKFLPDENMWTKDEYKDYLRNRGHNEVWDEVIYPSMKQAITHVLQACQDSLEFRKNSFELYGADFMLSDDMKPWLIEINCSPAMGPSTSVTERLCSEVIEDTLKVVIDRRDNKFCDTGKFELAFKQQYIPMPVYTGNNLTLEGEACRKPPQPVVIPQMSSGKLNRQTKHHKDLKQANEQIEEASITENKITSPLKAPRPCFTSSSTDLKPIVCSETLVKELSSISVKSRKGDAWKGCLCGQGKQCQVVSAYHVRSASLDVALPHAKDRAQPVLKYTRKEDNFRIPNRLTKQTLKLSRMHRRAKRKIAYATLKYKRSSEGPGLSIGPGNGVKQI